MERIEQPTRDQPRNTILFCKKPWQIPALALAFMVLLTFMWAGIISVNYKEMEFYEESYELSLPEFLFRDMANTGFHEVSKAVAPGVVGIGATAINMPPVATGSIVSARGHVITALHPLKNLGDISVFVKTNSGTIKYRAEIAKSLPSHNLALLKILSPDRFMYFPLAETATLQTNSNVMGIGYGSAGSLITKEGRILQMNTTLAVGAMQISHLLSTDAIFSWEQNGGPLINALGELIGVGMSVTGTNALVQGYAVPAHVLAADFGDVVDFRVNKNRNREEPAFVNAAQPVTGTGNVVTGSASWWTRARAQVNRQNPSMGMNVAGQIQDMTGVPNGSAPPTQPQVQKPQAPATPLSPAGVTGMVAMSVLDTDHLNRVRIGGFTVGDVFSLMLLAVVVGTTSGMVTMGGGVLMVAGMMVIFGYGMHLIRPVAYLTNLFIFGAAMRRNSEAGMVMWSTVKPIVPWACAGVVIGYFIGNELGDRSIGILLGMFAALMAVRGVQEILNKDNLEEVILRTDGGETVVDPDDDFETLVNTDDEEAKPTHEIMVEQAGRAALGVPAGLFSGMMGISGGVIAVPMQRFFTGASLQNAIANSSVIMFWASLTGAVVAFVHGVPSGLIDVKAPLTISAIMIPGAYLGGFLGAKLMKVVPLVALRGVYTSIMAVIAVKMLFLS